MNILEKLNIETEHPKLYERAVTHTSYAHEHGCESYERLEFLGDAILELTMTDYLFLNFKYSEGEMTKYRQQYVCEDALYEYSMMLGLNECLRLGNGEKEHGGKYKKAMVADIYEAVVAAIYLDKGYDAAKKFIYETAIPHLKNHEFEFIRNYKSELQELVQTDRRSVSYEIINEEGPAHDKTFTAIVKIDDIKYGEGTAKSKKDAEQMAAKDALNKGVMK